jgi:hypothetical protein
MLDVFNNRIFNVISLTEAINRAPYKPNRMAELGLFTSKGVRTSTVVIEEKQGRLALVPTAVRNAPGVAHQRDKRIARPFEVPHIPYYDSISADEVSGIRAFGSEDRLQTVSEMVNDVLESMREDLEVTAEFHAFGAMNGVVLDADGTTVIYDWFDEFEITEKVVDFDFAGSGDPEIKALEAIRHIRDSVGRDRVTGFHAFCSEGFYDALVSHDVVRTAYDRWRDGEFLRVAKTVDGGSLSINAFPFGGIMWEEYRGYVGDVDFLEADTCRILPLGTRNIFKRYNAPANYIETVNRTGKPMYAKQERMKFDKGVELEAQMNPLFICTRPTVLVKGTIT